MNAALHLGWITPGTMEGCVPPSDGERLGRWAAKFFPTVEPEVWLTARNPWREERAENDEGARYAAYADAGEPDYYEDCIGRKQ